MDDRLGELVGSPEPESIRNWKVLVVDEPAGVHLFSRIFSGINPWIKIDSCGNLDKANEELVSARVGNKPYDLIFVSSLLPGNQDPYEQLSLKMQALSPSTFFVVMSDTPGATEFRDKYGPAMQKTFGVDAMIDRGRLREELPGVINKAYVFHQQRQGNFPRT